VYLCERERVDEGMRRAGAHTPRNFGGALPAAKKGAKPELYGSIPYASEQGIKSGPAGNKIDHQGIYWPHQEIALRPAFL
jgi:hypothetical protein